jgi:hypothetical protein
MEMSSWGHGVVLVEALGARVCMRLVRRARRNVGWLG